MKNRITLGVFAIILVNLGYYFTYFAPAPEVEGPVTLIDHWYLSDGGSFSVTVQDAKNNIFSFTVIGDLYRDRKDFTFYYSRHNGLFSLPYYPKKGGGKEKELEAIITDVIKTNTSKELFEKIKKGPISGDMIQNPYLNLYGVAQFLNARQER
jgi:hypothetical protein